jgi:hypothetical protein
LTIATVRAAGDSRADRNGGADQGDTGCARRRERRRGTNLLPFSVTIYDPESWRSFRRLFMVGYWCSV